MNAVTVAGAGLAGCEAAWQLARAGIPVRLCEMKPDKRTPAHESPLFAELVCSNSLRSERVTNAAGLLKAEMRLLDSLLLRAADQARVPAGDALAVDRERFSAFITQILTAHPLVEIVQTELTALPPPPAILATGPLTTGALSEAIAALPGLSRLHFFDAAAPIVTAESLEADRVFRAARYGRGEADYINCPLTEAEYNAFYEALLSAETAPVHGFEETKLYEGCMPVESLARRGRMALAFGPLRPVGLRDPNTGRMPFAVVQLRQDNAAGTLFNLVGFQTRLRFGEQARVFGMIPGLAHAEFVRFGVMHRNTFLDAPSVLNASFEMKAVPGLYFAGQITGVEGYVPSAASGLLAGRHLAGQLLGKPLPAFPPHTALGALGRYVSTPNRDYQPMGIHFGLIEGPPVRVRGKLARCQAIADRALASVQQILEEYA
jgi:methylenetetrahydrofolate--tRNA-(uracil-5-)-methyltransferase